jgi:LmbE family N-acetylglucosaminyl deacetylase
VTRILKQEARHGIERCGEGRLRRGALIAGAAALVALSAAARGLEDPATSAIPETPAEESLSAAGGDALAAIPPGTVLWIGAHPDDEVLLAPLLGALCAGGEHRCALLVATRGENGACRLPGGCHPDLGTVRTAEIRAAVRLYHARVLQGTLPDVFGPDPPGVRAAWAAAVGGGEALLDRLAGAIDGVAPRTIITFDPRHGTTCHNAHRAIGRLVLRALGRLSFAQPAVFLLESRVRIAPGGTSIRFSSAAPGDPELLRFDANHSRAPAPGTAWDYLLADARRQPSQFDATFMSSLLAVPPRRRAVFLLDAAVLGTDPSPLDLCTP